MKRILLSILWSLVFCHLSSQNIGDHIFAVVVSGGRNRLTNYERYWNDCAFLYSTLHQTCHVPKRNITLLMADGDDPAADMLCSGGARFASSPTDLDGDGQPDLHLSATTQNLTATFSQLASQLDTDDHLFVYHTTSSSTTGLALLHNMTSRDIPYRPTRTAMALSPWTKPTAMHAGTTAGPRALCSCHSRCRCRHHGH